MRVHFTCNLAALRYAGSLTLLWAATIILGSTISYAQEKDGQGAIASERFSTAIAHGRGVLGRLVGNGDLPGVGVAVAVNGEIVWSEGFGYANLEHRVPVTRHTRFGLGSISKALTMAGVMTLVDDGLLDLDTPIESYLSDFPHSGKGITLRRLAAHQSGLSDDFANAHYQTMVHFPTIDSAYQHIRLERLEYEPGSRLQYATGLYTIIGKVMEEVTGLPYLTIMQQRVFSPVGMRSTVPNDRRQLIPNRTGFYLKNASGDFENAPYFDPSFKLPGAGFLATAEDVARFGAALLRPGLLSEEARAEMFRAVPLSDGTPTEYALGLRTGELDGRAVLHLPGGGLGISAWLFLHPEDDLVIAVLSNESTAPVGGETHAEIARAFLSVIRRP